jgi:hypothetical protein
VKSPIYINISTYIVLFKDIINMLLETLSIGNNNSRVRNTHASIRGICGWNVYTVSWKILKRGKLADQ